MGLVMSSSPNDELKNCTLENTKSFAFDNIRVQAKILDVYDGDTVTAAFETLGAGIYSHKVRMLGIDTPEIRTKNLQEKKAALKAKEYLNNLLLNNIVLLHIKSTDKYGRILATIFVDKLNINEHMVLAGHARVYDGGKRESWFHDGDGVDAGVGSGVDADAGSDNDTTAPVV